MLFPFDHFKRPFRNIISKSKCLLKFIGIDVGQVSVLRLDFFCEPVVFLGVFLDFWALLMSLDQAYAAYIHGCLCCVFQEVMT